MDKPTAQAAFLAALERALPLYEEAAMRIEGRVEDSQTMATHFMIVETLKNDPNW